VSETARAELGGAFASARNAAIDAGCGALANVRRIVASARQAGLLDDEGDED
jgi:hypothetical protein